MTILVIDVGGTNIKLGLSGSTRRQKSPSGPHLTPARMVAAVKKSTAGWKYSLISIGYPGPVRSGKPFRDPRNLGKGWTRFDYARALGKPVRILNDAAMQALGAYQGGRMLFLGLGTGLGAALVSPAGVEPLELAHLPYRGGRTYEDYLGLRGLQRMGRARWERHVARVAELFQLALQADYVLLGGGNTKKLGKIPRGARVGGNTDAIKGGIRLWKRRR